MKPQYKVGQLVGCTMISGRGKVWKILDIYEPNVPGLCCGEPYVNTRAYTVFHISWGGIGTPEVFFESKQEADLWLAKKEIAHLKSELREEKRLHKRISKRFALMRKKINKIRASL
jgi:hypothetical protein